MGKMTAVCQCANDKMDSSVREAPICLFLWEFEGKFLQ